MRIKRKDESRAAYSRFSRDALTIIQLPQVNCSMIRVFVLLFISFTSIAQPMKVMTYNLRLDTQADGVNAWPNRKMKVIKLIKKQSPDIMGVQEALHNQMTDLKANLSQYDYVGVGRDDGKTKGEYSAIFYVKTRYQVIESNTFWLSETPEIAGSKSWDAAITRVATWVKLYDKKRKDTIFCINTHFDHIGKVAREKSIDIIKTNISRLAGKLPVILTGDFNIEPTETPYAIAINGETYNLRDAGAGSQQGTYCTFFVGQPCKRIDFIFCGVGWRVSKYSVITQSDGQYYPSDHLPVVALLKRM
jgi:endonuclease/exonuclease/phosphatase family metal-dependent hydrolase